MERIRKSLFWALVLSETSHVFCCVLPTVFTALSFLAGLGMVSMPAFLIEFHEAIHEWEIPIIAFSGAILVLGWVLHWYSLKIDCHDTGCCHPPCTPVKRRSATIMKIATVLFVANVLIYGVVHRGFGFFGGAEHGTYAHETHADHDHDHGAEADGE